MLTGLLTFAPVLAVAVATIYFISQQARLQEFGQERPFRPPPPRPPADFPYRPEHDYDDDEDYDESRRRRLRAQRDRSYPQQQSSSQETPSPHRSRHERMDYYKSRQDSSNAAVSDYSPNRQVYIANEFVPGGRYQGEEKRQPVSSLYVPRRSHDLAPLQPEPLLCVLCNDNPSNAQLLPCLHGDVCDDCIHRMMRSGRVNCPSCRAPIDGLQIVASHNAFHQNFDQKGIFVDSLSRKELQIVNEGNRREIERERSALEPIATGSHDSPSSDAQPRSQVKDFKSTSTVLSSNQTPSSGDFSGGQRCQTADEGCRKTSAIQQEASPAVPRSTHGHELLQDHTSLNAGAGEPLLPDPTRSGKEEDHDDPELIAISAPTPECTSGRPGFQSSGDARRRRRQSKKKRQRARLQAVNISSSNPEMQTSNSSAKPLTPTSSAKPQASTSTTKPQASTSTTKPQALSTIARPDSSTNTAKPLTSTSTAKPRTSTGTAKPRTCTSTATAQISEDSTSAANLQRSTITPERQASTSAPGLPQQDPDPELHECVLCYNNPSNVELLPCRHRSVCVDCVLLMTLTGKRDCPFCRRTISSFRRVTEQCLSEGLLRPSLVPQQQWSVWDDSEEGESEEGSTCSWMDESYVLWFVLSLLSYLALFCFVWRTGTVEETYGAREE